jgi:hypothetical protein
MAHFFSGETPLKKPGFSLQFLGLASQVLRDFRCNPLRPTGFLHFAQLNFL